MQPKLEVFGMQFQEVVPLKSLHLQISWCDRYPSDLRCRTQTRRILARLLVKELSIQSGPRFDKDGDYFKVILSVKAV